jgi:hypothetical protein
VIRENGRLKPHLIQNFRHFAQEIKRFLARYIKVIHQTVEGDDDVVGEAAILFEGGGFASVTNSILLTVPFCS